MFPQPNKVTLANLGLVNLLQSSIFDQKQYQAVNS
jgi:hypothetical protein